jgi:hypothetical protein
MNKERWFCPQKEVAVTIKYNFDGGYYEERIDYIEFGKKWEEDVKSLVRYHTQRELCLPYEQNWPIQKQIGYDNPKLAPFSWGTKRNTVYTEQNEVEEERVYCDTDYVVMGKIGKENWIEALWEKFVEVR